MGRGARGGSGGSDGKPARRKAARPKSTGAPPKSTGADESGRKAKPRKPSASRARPAARRSLGPALTLDLAVLREKQLDPNAAGPDDPGGRAEYFLRSRTDAQGRIPRKLFLEASRQRRALDRQVQTRTRKKALGGDAPAPPGGPGTVNWTPLGPSVIPHGQAGNHPPVSGRVRSLAVGVGAARVYAGAANGGVWLSEDGGTSWRPLDDYAVSPGTTSGLAADSLAVGALAVSWGATQATDLIYVGTGEPTGGDAYLGIGVKRSASGGAPGTWTLEGTNLAGRSFFRIAIDPEDTAIVLAATSAGLYRRPTAGSPASWTKITSAAFPNAMATDVIVAGTGASKRYYVAFMGGAVAVSSDLSTWTAITGSGSTSRTNLAAGQDDPSVVYTLGSNRALARLSGGSFQAVSGVPQALFFGDQGFYDMLLAVDPADADTVYIGGDLVIDGDWTLSLYKGTIAGGPGTWAFPFNSANDMFYDASGNPYSDNVRNDPTWVGRGIHPDGHTIAFAAAAGGGYDGTHVWIGCDGGVFASAGSGARGTYTARNTGLAITEMEYLAQRPDTDAVLFAGAQDNGNLRSWGEAAWTEAPEGDGGATLIDPNDQYRVMRQYIQAFLNTATDGGVSGSWLGVNFPPATGATPAQQNAVKAERKATGFYAPLAASPAGVSPTLAAFGTNRLWLTSDWGSSWVTLPTGTNPYVPATPNATQDVLDNNPVTGIVFASGTRIFVSTWFGVWRFDRSGTTWTQTALAGLPAGAFVTDVTADPGGNVYAVLGGSGVNHLYYHNGTSWTAAGPPVATLDVPCHAVAVDPANANVVFLGSDVGCWRGVKSGLTWNWAPFSQGLPEVAITDLAVHERARLLRAATHGRGVWEYPLDATAGQDPEIYLRVNSADTGRVTAGSRPSWLEGAQDPTRKGSNVYHWMSADIKVRRPSLASLPALNAPPDFGDFAANIGDARDTNNIETVDVTGTNRVFVEVHNRGLTPIPGSMVRVLLLVTDAYAGLPALPTGYAAKISAGDTSNWVAGSQWRFADAAAPYRTLPGPLDARVPQVVEFPLNIAALGLPTGHDHVCAAAFITTAGDPLISTQSSLDVLTMQDRHAAHRNLHVVALGATPGAPAPQPTTVVLGLANSLDRQTATELVFDTGDFSGHLSVVLPEHRYERLKTKGFLTKRQGHGDNVIETHLEQWRDELHERLRHRVRVHGEDLLVQQLTRLQFKRPLIASPGRRNAMAGLAIEPGDATYVAITLQAPEGARPGDVFTFDAIQRSAGQIVGGSTYMIGVRAPDPPADEEPLR